MSKLLNQQQPLNPNLIAFNGLECTFTEDGEWIYKAVPFRAKPVTGEQPHYQVVNELEDRYSDLLENRLSEALKDIVRYLKVS